MKTINITPKRLVSSKLCTVIISIICLGLSGCITSPFYGQKFSSKSDEIPFTVWTFDKTQPVTIECAKASAHGGVYSLSPAFHNVATIFPDNQGMFDANGLKVYAASTKKVLPAACWRNYDFPGPHDYITVIRVLQNGSDSSIYTFDKPGLECLGKWIGNGASWVSWLSHSCNKKYLGTDDPIRTVFLKAKF